MHPASPPFAGPDAVDTPRVTVVGAGLVGLCCALALVRAGRTVDLIDPDPAGGPQAASFGNGGWISPASVVPMSTPGLLARLPGLLLDRNGPLVLRPAAVPGLAAWLWRFVRAGSTLERVQATSSVLARLLRDAPERHARLAGAAGSPDAVQRNGLLYAYPDTAALQADRLGWALREAAGVAAEVLQGAALQAAAPSLSPRLPLALRVGTGAHVPDPGAYAAALQRLAVEQGVRCLRARVTGARFRAGRIEALGLQHPWSQHPAAPGAMPGEWPVQTVVLAAGIGTEALMRAFARAPGGPRCGLSLASERGYHLVLPGQLDWPQPVMPSDGRMAVTLTPAGLRVAGQVELARPGAPPDWHRVRVLWWHARRVLSPQAAASLGLHARALASDEPPAGATRWMGHRPSTPDGLPAIGPVPGCEGLFLACGHGHVGLATAPVSGELLAGWVTGGQPGAAAVLGDGVARACAPARFG